MKSHMRLYKTMASAFSSLLFVGIAVSQEHKADKHAGEGYVPGEIIVLLKPSSEKQTRLDKTPSKIARLGLPSLDMLNSRKGVIAIGESAARGVSEIADRRYVFKIPVGEEHNLIQAYTRNEHVAIVELNHVYRTTLTPGESNWSNQWNFDDNHIQAEKAWDIHTGSPNVIVGVIDTGLDHGFVA